MSGVYRPSPLRRLRLVSAAALLGALTLLAAACGSTVVPSSSVAGGNGATAVGQPPGDAELGVGHQPPSSPGALGGGAVGAGGAASAGPAPASGARPGAPAAVGHQPAPAGAPAAGSQQPPPAGSAAAPSAQDQAPAPPPASNALAPSASPGVTDTTVYLGAGFTRDQGAAIAAGTGAEGADPGDTRQYYDAVIDDLNARGGLASRQVEPVYYEIQTTSSESADSQAQAACAHWTQDNRVFAILEGGGPIAQQCAHDAGALDIVGGIGASTTATFDSYPNYVEVTSIRLDRMGRAVVPGLHDLGYFDPGARIGMVTWDVERYVQAIETDFVPALARVGQQVAEVARITVPSNMGALGDTQASISAAVLRFRSQGISHVMLLDGRAGFCAGGCISLLFLQTAEAQGYRPRYGFNSTNAQSNAQRYLFAGAEGQLQTAVGVTWYSSAESDEGLAPNPGRERCLALMAERGINTDNAVALAWAMLACDAIWFLEAAAADAPVLEVDAVMAGVHGLGDRYRAASSFGNRFGPDQRDGAVLVRNMVNDTECNCYRYPGPTYEPA